MTGADDVEQDPRLATQGVRQQGDAGVSMKWNWRCWVVCACWFFVGLVSGYFEHAMGLR